MKSRGAQRANLDAVWRATLGGCDGWPGLGPRFTTMFPVPAMERGHRLGRPIKRLFLPNLQVRSGPDGRRSGASVDKPSALPVQGGEEAAGAEQQGPLWQHRPPLVDPVQVAPRHVCHPDGTRRTVEKLISVSERDKTFTFNGLPRGNLLAIPNPELWLLREERNWVTFFHTRKATFQKVRL